MDWKRYYADELRSPEGRGFVQRLIEKSRPDPQIMELLANGSVVSFPHTSLFHGGDLVMRVVSSLYELKPSKVIALGVLHIWGLEPWARDYRALMAPGKSAKEMEELFSRLQGGFLPVEAKWETPFGSYPVRLPHPHEAVRGLPELEREYSLDLFFSLSLIYAREKEIEPLTISPLFIGMTAKPPGEDFSIARMLGDYLRNYVDQNTAVVATGDLVHFGTIYSPEDFIRELRSREAPVEQSLLHMVKKMLSHYLVGHDFKSGFHHAQKLNCDQRYMLPVIAEFLGPGAGFSLLEFRLSDYAPIWDVAPPCFVSSCLVAYEKPLFR